MNTIVNELELKSYWVLINEFVRHYPKQSLKCKRPQTFAILERMEDLNAENLAKTQLEKNKAYFFSRRWAAADFNPSALAFDYPIVAAFEKNATMIPQFSKDPTKICYNIDIAFLDQYNETCAAGKDDEDECGARNISEIYEDTEKFVRLYIRYMSEVVYTDRPINIHVNAVTEQKAIDTVLTRKFQKLLKDNMGEVTLYREDGTGKDDVFGTIITQTFCIHTCEQFNYDATENNFNISFDKNCCS